MAEAQRAIQIGFMSFGFFGEVLSKVWPKVVTLDIKCHYRI